MPWRYRLVTRKSNLTDLTAWRSRRLSGWRILSPGASMRVSTS